MVISLWSAFIYHKIVNKYDSFIELYILSLDLNLVVAIMFDWRAFLGSKLSILIL
jgi:hypothetical protein